MNIVMTCAERLNLFLIQFGLDQQLLSMGITPLDLTHGFFSLMSGFIFGMLAKRYFRILFWIGLFSATIIFFLEYKSIVNINWTAMNVFLGLAETSTFDSLLTMFFEWLKQNVLVSVISTIGFLLGLKA
ncbi:hypothetical protein COB28_02400 [Candidatus Dependentiae bacterium]|nr:MAG: hypothetical protein COB28_02400 [Candidatus Dependentiae bacterium]